MKILSFITTSLILLLSGCAAVGPADGSKCEFCNIVIGQILPEGGLIFTENNQPVSQQAASNLATQNCRLRGFDGANMDRAPYDMGFMRKWQHHYSCYKAAPIQAPSTTSPQISRNPSGNINESKDKCKELGFKQGTEQFGNCVLKLSK